MRELNQNEINEISGGDDRDDASYAGMGVGAGLGARAGATFGPAGVALGALIGGVAGYFTGRAAYDASH
jgi:hypothetical protein